MAWQVVQNGYSESTKRSRLVLSNKEFETKLTALVSSGDYTSAMAISKLLIASLVVSLLVLQEVNASQAASTVPGKNMDCGGASGTCSKGCNCDHKGTSGNLKDAVKGANVTMKDTCPCCGATMTTLGGRRMYP
ncbi:hypothetical protein Peur_009786 [Populus x canadensis]